MPLASNHVAVLGAGLQGACIALELADRGAKIDLYERNNICLAEASSNNEAKVHLGFTYACDRTLGTAQLMARGALSFEPLLRRWLGAALSDLPTSSPTYYVVHRDGLITSDDFERYASQVTALLATAAESGRSNYFGRDFQRPASRLSDDLLATKFCRDTAVAASSTEEKRLASMRWRSPNSCGGVLPMNRQYAALRAVRLYRCKMPGIRSSSPRQRTDIPTTRAMTSSPTRFGVAGW